MFTLIRTSLVRSAAVVALLGCLSVVPLAATEWKWTSERVDGPGHFLSMVADNSGNLHLAFVSQSQLVYAFRPAGAKNGAKQTWFTMPVDKGAWATGIAVDSKGHPAICYELADARLRFAYFDRKQWSTQEISPTSPGIEYTCTVAFDRNDTPHVFWYQTYRNAQPFYHLRHAELVNGVWRASTVDTAAETGKWHFAAEAPNGRVLVAYSAFQAAELRLARSDGESWQIETVDAPPRGVATSVHPIYGAAIAFDRGEDPVISYEDEGALRLAHRDKDKWQVEQVDVLSPRLNWWENRTSVAVDASGSVHIIYQDNGAIKHAYQDNGKWRIETVVASGLDNSRFPTMVAGKDCTLYVAYRDPDDGTVKLAIGRPEAIKATQLEAVPPPTSAVHTPSKAAAPTEANTAKTITQFPAAKSPR